MKKLLILTLITYIVSISFGLYGCKNGEDTGAPSQPANTIAPIEYTPTLDGQFESSHTVSQSSLVLDNSKAPFVFKNATQFANKRLTKLDIPLCTAKSKFSSYITITIVKLSSLTSGDKILTRDYIFSDDYRYYKIDIPSSELNSTEPYKWVSLDLSDYFIYTRSDETFAFMDSNDPITCAYFEGDNYPFMPNNKESISGSLAFNAYTDTIYTLNNKNLSIIGDSISTYDGISNDTNANSTIGNGKIHYPQAQVDSPTKTWWWQTCNATEMNLLVNNSWSGSRVATWNENADNSEPAYLTRAEQLHDDVGENAGTEPNVIAVYIGINDFAAKTPIGTVNSLSDVYSEQTGYIEPTTFAEAYLIMIHKMLTRYENADIFLFNIPKCYRFKNPEIIKEYNAAIAQTAEILNLPVVDFYNAKNYSPDKHTSDGSHLTPLGMNFLADIFMRTMEGYYLSKQ